jgi:acyl-coenzyme A synthetase/AMP-(fatty) acid ligase
MSLVFHPCAQHRDEDVVARGAREGDAEATRTLAELLADAGAVAARLRDFPRGSEVAVVCHDRYDFAVALLAAMDRGLVVALPPNARPEALRQLRVEGRVQTVISDQDGVPGIDVRGIARGAPPIARPAVPSEQPLVVVYTSGSTGASLPCAKTAGQLLGEAAVLARTFGIERGAAIVPTVPPHHIYGLLFGVLVPLAAGAAFCRETPFYEGVVRRIVARDRARVLVSVPVHLRSLAMMEAAGIETLGRIFSSGAPLPRETRSALEARFGWRITDVLGSSETGGIAHRDGSDAPYTALEGVEVGADEDGRLLVTSPFLPRETPQPFATGDRIELLGPGRFRHLGRADGVLKVGSTRVSLGELEARIAALPGVKDVAVVPVSARGGRGQESWAVIALEEGAALGAGQVREALRAWLDPVVLPRRYRFVPALPREGTGKLRREALLALFEGDE